MTRANRPNVVATVLIVVVCAAAVEVHAPRVVTVVGIGRRRPIPASRCIGEGGLVNRWELVAVFAKFLNGDLAAALGGNPICGSKPRITANQARQILNMRQHPIGVTAKSAVAVHGFYRVLCCLPVVPACFTCTGAAIPRLSQAATHPDHIGLRVAPHTLTHQISIAITGVRRGCGRRRRGSAGGGCGQLADLQLGGLCKQSTRIAAQEALIVTGTAAALDPIPCRDFGSVGVALHNPFHHLWL